MTEEQLNTDPFAAVRISEFRSLIAARFTFVMGLRMMSTTVGWWIYNLTNSPLAIGIVGLSEFIPAISFALYAGHVIDISEKRKMALRCLALYLVASLILLFLSTGFTARHMHAGVIAVCIYAVIFGTGIVRAFVGPVFNVILASIVPKSTLQNATTWNQGAFLSASVTGHATAGFLIAMFSNTGTLIAIALMLASALTILFQIKPKPAINERGEKKTWD